jgi:vancomycin resistance protein YoaR
MHSEIQNAPQKDMKKNSLPIAVIIIALLAIFAISILSFATLNKTTIYKGVYINGLDVSGLTYETLIDRLDNEYNNKLDSLEISLKTDEVSKKTNLKELDVKYDIEAAANEAFSIGRDGNPFKRLFKMLSSAVAGYDIQIPVSYDSSALNGFLTLFDKLVSSDVKDEEIIISDNKVILRTGQQQKYIDLASIKEELVQMIEERKDGVIDVDVEITPPKNINLDDLYAKLNVEPVNASFTLENGKVEVIAHKDGMSVSKAILSQIVSDLDGKHGVEKEIPVEFIKAELTTEEARSRLFADDLAYFSTKFNTNTTNNANRAHNMRLASSKINGMILLPGEEFSFNTVVGPRSTAAGYKSANIYSAGEVVDGVGGGICQVSSTLYGAVLRADLDVSYRRNHSLTVGYVPYGQDATVSYGAIDFKFVNSTGWPVKIVAGVTSDNNMYFRLIGTKTDPGKKVSISSTTLQTIPFTEKYIEDPQLEEGKTVVVQNGKNGYVVDTFKTIKVGDKVISHKKLHTSKYNPLPKEIKVGTKPVPEKPPADKTPTPDPETPPVDPPENPPVTPPEDEVEQPDPSEDDIIDNDLPGDTQNDVPDDLPA